MERKTRKQVFLERMDTVLPYAELVQYGTVPGWRRYVVGGTLAFGGDHGEGILTGRRFINTGVRMLGQAPVRRGLGVPGATPGIYDYLLEVHFISI